MRNKYILLTGIMIGVLLSSVAVVLAGNLNPSAGPNEANSQMYTLENIYDRLNDGTEATKMTFFTEPSSGPTAGTMHTLDEIYYLIGKRAFVPKTGQTTSYIIGDDGDLEMGVEWPSPRFITGTTGVVTDTLTGLIWLKNANCAGGFITWTLAISYSNALYDGCTDCFGTLSDCGLSDGSIAGDWRLPNVRELQSLIDYAEYDPALPDGHPFTGVLSAHYWSSTGDLSGAWFVNLNQGYTHLNIKSGDVNYVWPVRSGQ